MIFCTYFEMFLLMSYHVGELVSLPTWQENDTIKCKKTTAKQQTKRNLARTMVD